MAQAGPGPGEGHVGFWGTIRDALTRFHVPWDPEADEDVRFLREQATLARRETLRLRRLPAWEDLIGPQGEDR
jgi:hypothetical protein